MYVKILDHDHNRAAVIYSSDPSQPLHFGRERIERDPSPFRMEELMEELGVGCDSMDRTHVGSDPTGYFNGDTERPYWEVRWVRFHKPGDLAVHLVCSTTPVYLVDESGKTIDKV